MTSKKLVIFGVGNFLSDLFDAALARGLSLSKVVWNVPENTAPGNVPAAERIRRLGAAGAAVQLQPIEAFEPATDELYVVGITGAAKQTFVEALVARFGIPFCNLVHPASSVSPFATLGEGVFVGAGSVIAPGVRLGNQVVINRAASVGHDTEVGYGSRVQPGAIVCGLGRIGRWVTVGAGATVIERMCVGDGAYVGAGAVVVRDVPPRTLVVGVPATFAKSLE